MDEIINKALNTYKNNNNNLEDCLYLLFFNDLNLTKKEASDCSKRINKKFESKQKDSND